MKNSGTQIPSFSPLSTFSPCRTGEGSRGRVTTAWPSAASVGARITARSSASGHARRAEQDEADAEARDERQRQPDPEQARGDRDLAAQRPEVDPRRIPEEHERERRLGEQLDRLARDSGIDEPERVAPDEKAERREHHRPGDRRSVETSRDGGKGEQRERDRRQCPVHVQTLLRVARLSPRNRGSRQASVVVELPPVVEIVPSTVPFETVQVELTVRVPPPGSVHVPVKPVSSSAVSVPSQIVPLANCSCSAVSATLLSPVRRSIRKATATRRCR